MPEHHDGSTVIFDPSTVPPEDADYLASEILLLVRWMMLIPKYKEAMDGLTRARRTAEGR